MACIAFFVGLVMWLRRRGSGKTVVVPVALVLLGAARLAMVSLGGVRMLTAFQQTTEHVRPEDKATILAAMLSEAINALAFEQVVEVPLFVGALIVDRQLGKRQPTPRAAPAPSGATCPVHAGVTATNICSRCGAFMCAACSEADARSCPACLTRSPA